MLWPAQRTDHEARNGRQPLGFKSSQQKNGTAILELEGNKSYDSQWTWKRNQVHLAKPWFQPGEIWSRKSGHTVPRLWPIKNVRENICIVLNTICGNLLDSKRKLTHIGYSQISGAQMVQRKLLWFWRGVSAASLWLRNLSDGQVVIWNHR